MTDQEKEVRNLAFCHLAQIYEGTKPMDEWKPDEHTVLWCIEHLPRHCSGQTTVSAEVSYQSAMEDARKILAALLPKPATAKALVDEYHEARPTAPGNWHYIDYMRDMVDWLISEGKLQP